MPDLAGCWLATPPLVVHGATIVADFGNGSSVLDVLYIVVFAAMGYLIYRQHQRYRDLQATVESLQLDTEIEMKAIEEYIDERVEIKTRRDK